MKDVKTLHRRALERFGQHVRDVRDDQWHGQTPCTDWDVRVLVNHLVYENLWMPPILEGKRIAGLTSVLWIERHATPRATSAKRFTSAPAWS